METQDPGGPDPSAGAAQRDAASLWKGTNAPTDAPVGAEPSALVAGKKLPGAKKWGDLTMKKGRTDRAPTDTPGGAGKAGLWNWRKIIVDGHLKDPSKQFGPPTDTPVGAGLTNAWPSKVHGPASSSTESPHDKPFRGRYVVVLASALLLLLGGGALYVVGPWAVRACPTGMRDPAMLASVSGNVPAPCGVSKTDSSADMPPTSATNSAVLATATAPAQPSATTRPTATATPRPTATATPIPPPTVSILAPANNSIATNTNGDSPMSDPITFHASASPGAGATSVTITWLDSLDGTLGTGAILVHSLSSQHHTNCGAPTAHVVTAKALNNLGRVASVSITVSVVPNCLA